MIPTPQLSPSGVRWRRAMGVPLDAPKVGRGRGGNYRITEDKARQIWSDIQHFTKCFQPKTVNITQLVADKHGVSKTLVNNIRHGRSWNHITGLDFKQYE